MGELKLTQIITQMGIAYYDGYKLVGLETDGRDRLCGVKLLDCNSEAR